MSAAAASASAPAREASPMVDAPAIAGPSYADALRSPSPAAVAAPNNERMLRAYIARLETDRNADRLKLAQARVRIEEVGETPLAPAAPPAPAAVPAPASAAAVPAGVTDRPADASRPVASAADLLPASPVPALAPASDMSGPRLPQPEKFSGSRDERRVEDFLDEAHLWLLTAGITIPHFAIWGSFLLSEDAKPYLTRKLADLHSRTGVTLPTMTWEQFRSIMVEGYSKPELNISARAAMRALHRIGSLSLTSLANCAGSCRRFILLWMFPNRSLCS